MGIRSYCGNAKPFMYTVFHPTDKDKVQEVLERLDHEGYAFCYQNAWNKRSSAFMGKASLVMIFVSPVALAEEWINQAIHHCVQHNLPILCVYLEPTVLTPAQKLQLNTYQGLMLYEFPDRESFYQKLMASSHLQFSSITKAQAKDARRKSIELVLGSGFLAIFLSVFFLASVGGSVQAGSLLNDLGFSGSLDDINQVYVYATKTMEQNQGDSQPLLLEDREYLKVLRTGIVLAKGDVDDLSDFSQLRNLKDLVFAGNEIRDLSPLYELRDLQHLDVSCNPITDLAGIHQMKSLESINLSYTKVGDLSPLKECPSLKTVRLSCDMDKIAGLPGPGEPYQAVIGEHNWGNWEVVQASAPGNEGQEQRVCSNCGETQSRVTAALPQEEDIANVGIENLEPHIFGGVEEWGPVEGANAPYGIFLYGISRDYAYVFRKNGEIISTDGREYMGDSNNPDPFKTHIFPDRTRMGGYDPNATYTLEASYNGKAFTYTIRHKNDR